MFPPPLDLSAAYGGFFRGVSGFRFPVFRQKKATCGKQEAGSGEVKAREFPVSSDKGW
jgi:hypothetical protein